MFLLKEKGVEEVTILSTGDPIGVYAKPESYEGTIDACLACRINGFIRTWFVDKRKFCNACEDDRVVERKIH